RRRARGADRARQLGRAEGARRRPAARRGRGRRGRSRRGAAGDRVGAGHRRARRGARRLARPAGGGAMRTALAAIALCGAGGRAAPGWAPKPGDAHPRLAVDGDAIPGRLDVAVRDLDAALELDADGNGEITWRELSDGAPRIAEYVTRRLTLGADGAPCTL